MVIGVRKCVSEVAGRFVCETAAAAPNPRARDTPAPAGVHVFVFLHALRSMGSPYAGPEES